MNIGKIFWQFFSWLDLWSNCYSNCIDISHLYLEHVLHFCERLHSHYCKCICLLIWLMTSRCEELKGHLSDIVNASYFIYCSQRLQNHVYYPVRLWSSMACGHTCYLMVEKSISLQNLGHSFYLQKGPYF